MLDIGQAWLDAQARKALALKRKMADRPYADIEAGKQRALQTESRTPGVKRMPPPPDISRDQARVRGVMAALVRAGVVEDVSLVDWFGINENELIVNGRRQPASLHQELKEQYEIRPRHGLFYGPVEMVGQGIFLEKGDL